MLATKLASRLMLPCKDRAAFKVANSPFLAHKLPHWQTGDLTLLLMMHQQGAATIPGFHHHNSMLLRL